jgi:hypothetical protein
MVSIEVRNASRRLVRPYFSKLGWLAKVIWRIAIPIPLPFYERSGRTCDLFRGSLAYKPSQGLKPRRDYGGGEDIGDMSLEILFFENR